METVSIKNFLMENGKTVYYYVTQNIKRHPENKVPLVLFICEISCNPVGNVVESGGWNRRKKENFIVISPNYNNYATYSETDFLVLVVEYMIANYPVDCTRIYSAGSSTGAFAQLVLADQRTRHGRIWWSYQKYLNWDRFRGWKSAYPQWRYRQQYVGRRSGCLLMRIALFIRTPM